MPQHRRLRALLALASLAVTASLMLPAGALASCRMTVPLEEDVRTAEVVFIGTVRATANAGRQARVSVEEIWRGPMHFGDVVIVGGPEGNLGTSVDRQFEVGVRYIFFPHLDPVRGMTDNSCSSTQPTTDDTWRLRPATALTLDKSYGDDPVTFNLFAVVVGGLLLLALAAFVGVVEVVRGRSD